MKKFTYEARDQSSGKAVKSTVQAESEHAAAAVLIRQGFTPLSIKEQASEPNIFKRLKGRITTKDRVVFLRQLSTLIGAGLPLAQSLRTVTEQTENKQLQNVIQEIVADVEGGHALADSFAKHPDVFDKTVLALVSAGEASGTLDKALKRIAEQKEKDAAMMSKVRGAMIYPSIVLVVIIAVLLFMLLTIVPEVRNLYDDMGQSLPFLTQIMIAVADFILNYWWLVIIILGILGYFARQYFKTDSGIKALDTFKLNVPLFNSMFRKLYMARFARTGQTLLSTGVSMLDMLRISSEGVNNVVVSKSIDNAAEKVKSGKALSASLMSQDYILVMLPQMIKIGEQSGSIDSMLGKTAQVYEDELDSEIRALSTTIEPVLMVIMAVLVGGMVAAVLFPIYSLVGSIR